MIANAQKTISNKKILLFWGPLILTWLMMSVEGPFISAIIARLADPKFNLAAYGVAFSLALIVEAPIIMIMSASTALVKNKDSFKKLRNFTYALNLSITLLMLVLLIPPIFDFLTITLIGLPVNVAALTHKATFLLLPWPAAIGYRRFYQGILINSNQTRKVAYNTIIRLVFMMGTALALYYLTDFSGVVVGALALSAGVTSEGFASKLMAMSLIKNLKEDHSTEELNYRYIAKFYYPLALTSIISLGVHPMVTFFLGKSSMSIESLAVLPVINSLVFIFRSIGLSYQEVSIALMGDNFKNYKPLRNYAFFSGNIVVILLALVAFTPLSEIWFRVVSGLSMELSLFSILPLKILAIMPGLTFLISFQRAILVYSKKTKPLTTATALEVGGILLVLFVTIHFFDAIGVIAAALSYVFGRLIANSYLAKPYSEALKDS